MITLIKEPEVDRADLEEVDGTTASDSSAPEVDAEEEHGRSLAYRIYRALRFWVLLAIIVGAILASGLSAFVVKTGSMRPTYYPGDVVIAVNPNIVPPAVGRVVVATPKVAGQDLPAIAHRIITQNADGTWTTKGDYNPEPDSWRDNAGDIQKVVIAKVPMNWVRNPLVIAGGIGLIGLIFLWPSAKQEGSADGDEGDGSDADDESTES